MVKRDPVKECIIEELSFNLLAESPEQRLQAFKELLDYREFASAALELRKHCFRETNPKVRHFALSWYDRTAPGRDKEQDTAPAATGGSAETNSPAALMNLKKRLAVLDDPAEKIKILRKSRLKGDKAFLNLLAGEIRPDDDPIFLGYVISLFGRSTEPAHASLLIGYLSHGNQRVRANTIDALGAMRPAMLNKTLAGFLEDPDNRIRANAILALYPVDRENARRSLLQLSESDQESHRDSAVYCLSQMPAAETGDLLRKMFERETVSDLVQKQAYLLFPLLCDKDVALLTAIIAKNSCNLVKRALTKKMLAQLGLAVTEDLLLGASRFGRWRLAISKYFQAAADTLADYLGYDDLPLLQIALVVLVCGAAILSFPRSEIRTAMQPATNLASLNSVPRIKVSAPPGCKQMMSIKGVVCQVGDSWALVKTRNALYQVSFLNGLPAGCLPEATVEANGLYTGYDYASSTILLACMTFRPASRGRDIWGG